MVFNWIVNQLKTYDNKVNSVFSDNKILKEKNHILALQQFILILY